MRISSNYIFDTYLKYDKARQADIVKYSNQLSSGKKLLNPSDDPISLAQSLRFKSIKSDLDGYTKNIDITRNIQLISETALTNIIETSQETRVEIVRLLNTGVLDSDDAEVLKSYLIDTRDYLINLANLKIGDKYVFSGVTSQTAPIDASGVYQGSQDETTVPIAKGVEVPIRYNGNKYLGIDNDDDKMILVKVIDRVVEIIDNALSGTGSLTDLNRDDVVTVNGQTMSILDGFDTGLSAIMQYRSVLGSQNKTVEDIRMQHEMFKVNYSELISKLEDADLANSIAQLEKSKIAYEATIASFAQNKDLSLLKYFK